ncbi:MAG: hypothetical protein ACM3H9_02725, partial [Rhodospirillaceae bacterium]
MSHRVSAIRRAAVLAAAALAAASVGVGAAQQSGSGRSPGLPSTALTFGAFTAIFGEGGAFSLEGQGWPALKGTWTAASGTVEIVTTGGPKECSGPGKYQFKVDGQRVTFAVQSDACVPRRMILDRSTWSPAGMSAPAAARRIVLTPGAAGPLPRAA